MPSRKVAVSRKLKQTPPMTGKALVFISHDTRDADLAAAFCQLLEDLTYSSVRPFRSSDKSGATGVDYGAAWYTVLMDRLSEAQDVVALLTPRSIERPWLLYEVGVAVGWGRAEVFGVALGLPEDRVRSGPFSQIQFCRDDEESLTGLVIQLIRKNIPGSNPQQKAVGAAVKEFRAKVARAAKSKPPEPALATTEEVAVRIYEEMRVLTREFRLAPSWRQLGPRFFKAFPLAGPGSAGGLGWLIFLSALRNTLPWFYELGLGLYRALEAGDGKRIAHERELVLNAVEKGLRNEWLRSVVADEDRERTGRLFFLADLIEIYLRPLAPVHGPRRAASAAVGKRRKA